jgi:hypothetical protein
MELVINTTTRQPLTEQTVTRKHNLLTRFLNWYGSGSTDIKDFKADVGHAHKFMLIQGQVIPVKAQTVSLAPIDPAP